MKKFPHSREVVILQSIALVCFVYEVGDIFNIITFLPISEISLLILPLVALLLSSQAHLQENITRLEEDVRRYSREDDIEYMSLAHMQVSKPLRELIGDDFFVELFTSLQTILKDQVVHFKEDVQFLYYYFSTLKHYRSETFLCLTNINTYAFWLDPQVKDANERFIKGGGTIEQLFFFEHACDLDSDAVKEFFLSQKAINVRMFVVSASLVTHMQHMQIQDYVRSNIIVGAKANVAWEVFIDSNGHVGPSSLIMKPEQVSKYRSMIKLARKYKKEHFSSVSHTA